MKYIIPSVIFFSAIFAVNPQISGAWTYNGTSINYTVTAAPVITVDLTATPTTMTLPTNQTVLSWTTTGSPDSCIGTSTPSGTSWNGMGLSPSGSGGSPITISGLTAGTYVFDITCTKSGSSPTSDSEVVVVNPAPTTQCSDNIDNADPEDSDADINDPGCHLGDIITNAYDPNDDNETNTPLLPDLTTGSITPTTATVSVSTSFSATITNIGNASTVSSFTNLFQFDNDADHGTVVANQTVTAGPISAGGNASPSSSYTFGSVGTWYARACADNNASFVGSINESNEANNCGSWVAISVTSAPPPPTPSVSLSALPSTVFTGNSATLSWTSANVSSCTASANPVSGTWTGARPTSSSFPHESTGALSATTTFTLLCTGVNGSASDQKTVTVINPGSGVTVDLTATPTNIASGESSLLTWISNGATSCSGIGFNTGGLTNNTTGVSVSPIRNTTYTINCINGSDSASDQATVTLKRKFFFIEF